MTEYHRTLMLVEVLGHEPYDGGLEGLAASIFEGEFSGTVLMESTSTVAPEQMAQLLVMQGSSPEFLLGEPERRVCENCGLREADYAGSSCPNASSGHHAWVSEDEDEEPERATCRHCTATIVRYATSLTGAPDGHWRDEVPDDEHPSGGDGFRGDATCGVRTQPDGPALGHEPVEADPEEVEIIHRVYDAAEAAKARNLGQ